MPVSYCHRCRAQESWTWEDAFNKFGFGDGDCFNGTRQIAWVLEQAGFTVEITHWGMHNTLITSILDAKGVEQIPADFCRREDYASKRLPQPIVTLLEEAFPSSWPSWS